MKAAEVTAGEARVVLAKKLHADKSLEINDICKTLRIVTIDVLSVCPNVIRVRRGPEWLFDQRVPFWGSLMTLPKFP